nr:MAG TPA: hypothetical protein [Bacteriophage sp.]
MVLLWSAGKSATKSQILSATFATIKTRQRHSIKCSPLNFL